MVDAIGIADVDWFRGLRDEQPTPDRVNVQPPPGFVDTLDRTEVP